MLLLKCKICLWTAYYDHMFQSSSQQEIQDVRNDPSINSQWKVQAIQESVIKNNQVFYVCKQCGQVYWEGKSNYHDESTKQYKIKNILSLMRKNWGVERWSFVLETMVIIKVESYPCHPIIWAFFMRGWNKRFYTCAWIIKEKCLISIWATLNKTNILPTWSYRLSPTFNLTLSLWPTLTFSNAMVFIHGNYS